MGGCVNIMGSCVSFQIKVQILAFYTDVCKAPKAYLNRNKALNYVHYDYFQIYLLFDLSLNFLSIKMAQAAQVAWKKEKILKDRKNGHFPWRLT